LRIAKKKFFLAFLKKKLKKFFSNCFQGQQIIFTKLMRGVFFTQLNRTKHAATACNATIFLVALWDCNSNRTFANLS